MPTRHPTAPDTVATPGSLKLAYDKLHSRRTAPTLPRTYAPLATTLDTLSQPALSHTPVLCLPNQAAKCQWLLVSTTTTARPTGKGYSSVKVSRRAVSLLPERICPFSQRPPSRSPTRTRPRVRSRPPAFGGDTPPLSSAETPAMSLTALHTALTYVDRMGLPAVSDVPRRNNAPLEVLLASPHFLPPRTSPPRVDTALPLGPTPRLIPQQAPLEVHQIETACVRPRRPASSSLPDATESSTSVASPGLHATRDDHLDVVFCTRAKLPSLARYLLRLLLGTVRPVICMRMLMHSICTEHLLLLPSLSQTTLLPRSYSRLPTTAQTSRARRRKCGSPVGGKRSAFKTAGGWGRRTEKEVRNERQRCTHPHYTGSRKNSVKIKALGGGARRPWTCR
ncbi:hypothetical protein B0H19DRAFT_1260388 [Mycena capillaripes]|nr:hypothetical protein B0H19DRAFT_1260388 [Mycena capillaripes]